jgi:hypothetical protein
MVPWCRRSMSVKKSKNKPSSFREDISRSIKTLSSLNMIFYFSGKLSYSFTYERRFLLPWSNGYDGTFPLPS